MKISKLFLMAGIVLILGGGPAEAGKSLYLPLILKNKCTDFTFLAFGDSITTGYGSGIPPNDWYSIPHSGYVGRLYDNLHSLYPRQDISFYNMGKGGETTDSGLVRFGPTISQLACYTASGCIYPVGHAEFFPTLILIMEGTNDLNISNPFDMIDRDLRAMVSTALLYDYEVMIATIPPVCNRLIFFPNRKL
jgi:lysophospholipase L1-like esterase